MAKIIALCGKICSGKSTYAEKIQKDYNAVVLNADVLMLSLFDEQLGDRHDDVDKKVTKYLYFMAEKIINTNTNVILDLGFWTNKARQDTRLFFEYRNIDVEFHYINTPLDIIKTNIEKRNADMNKLSYHIDENILQKCLNAFEEPDDVDINVIV